MAVRALRVMWRCLELVELQNPIFHCCNTRNMEIPEKLFLLINRAREIKRGEPCGQDSRWGLPKKTFLKLIAATKAKKRPHSKVLESIISAVQWFRRQSMPCRGIYKKVEIFPETVASKYRDAFQKKPNMLLALKK